MECPSSKPSTPWRGSRICASPVCRAGNAHAQGLAGYKSVAEARQAATTAPGAVSEQQGGWLVVEDRDTDRFGRSRQTTTRIPAVVKRTVAERDGRSFIDM